MTEQELFTAIADDGWTRVQFKKLDSHDVLPGEEGALEHWVLGVVKTDAGVTCRKNLLVYKWPDKSYTWQEKDPFPVETPHEFITSLRSYLDGVSNTEAYTIGKVSIEKERAFVALLLDEGEAGYREVSVVVVRKAGSFSHKSLIT